MDNFRALILLNTVEGISGGGVFSKKLIDAFGSASAVFNASMASLTNLGLKSAVAKRILDAPSRFDVDKELDDAKKNNIRILTIFDRDYPEILKQIYGPPTVLYVKGHFIEADKNAIAVVGSRGASYYGLSCAKEFAHKLAQSGLTIVSGLARGVDTAAHLSTLDAGGRTIAVLGSGLNNIYPPENEGLAGAIAEKGAVVSQFPLNTAPLAQNFPIRNRIISGLSLGTLVVEASDKSGALITAKYALEQNREVFAIPGKLSSPTSLGTNSLIKQGAKMVTQPQEVIQELKYIFSTTFCNPERSPKGEAKDMINLDSLASPQNDTVFNEDESRIMQILSGEPKYADVVSQETGMIISQAMSILMQLELKGVIKQLPGKMFVKIF